MTKLTQLEFEIALFILGGFSSIAFYWLYKLGFEEKHDGLDDTKTI